MKTLLTIAFICAVSAQAFSFGDVTKIIDTKKAVESVNKDEAKKALKKGKNISIKDIQNSIDLKKAKESIDIKKMKSFF